MGCLSVKFERIGGMDVRIGLVCGTDFSPAAKVLFVSDGPLMTVDGGYLFTTETTEENG